jgi:NTE family protein
MWRRRVRPSSASLGRTRATIAIVPSLPTVAVACQGGGSHAAFTAGVLERLLEPDVARRRELVALSGTSGGAVCAALAWSGLVARGPEGGRPSARARLRAFWRDVAADDFLDAAVNSFTVFASRMPGLADFTPQPFVSPAEAALRALLERHVGLDALDPAARAAAPELLVGATDVLRGERRVFRGAELTLDQILASAAVPRLFRAVPVGDSVFWDGLFACNPPVRELTELVTPPDEIWVVRLNPRRRAKPPVLLFDVVDRLNELSGNLSLDDELASLARMNKLREQYPELKERYKRIDVREIELDEPRLDYASKMDRSPELLERLRERGREKAAALLATL